MTLGDVLVRYLLANLLVFGLVALTFSLLAGLLGFWFGASWAYGRAEVEAAGLGSWDTSGWLAESGAVFEPGVAKVSDL